MEVGEEGDSRMIPALRWAGTSSRNRITGGIQSKVNRGLNVHRNHKTGRRGKGAWRHPVSTAPLCGVDGHNNADVTTSVAWPALCCVADVFAGLTQSPEPPRRAGDQTTTTWRNWVPLNPALAVKIIRG